MLRRALVGFGALCALLPISTQYPRAASRDIVLTAGSAVDMHGHWSRVTDASAAGGVMLATPDAGWQNTTKALAAPPHYVDFTFLPAPSTPYRVWVRLRASDGSATNDSVFLQFSNARDANNKARYRLGTTEGLVVSRQACAGCELPEWGWHNGAFWVTQPTLLSFTTSGSQTLRIQTREDGVEIDQIVLSPETYLSSAPGAPDRDTTILDGGEDAGAPQAAHAIPGAVPADQFDEGGPAIAYHDTTVGDSGNGTRETNVDIRALKTGGYAVSWIAPGEWLAYTIDVAAAGDYVVESDVAADGVGGTFHLDFAGGLSTGAISIPDTGGATKFTTLKRRITLAAGVQRMRVVFDAKATRHISLAAIRILSHSATPYRGTAIAVPGIVNAVEFDAGGPGISHFDTTVGNAGGQVRDGDADIYGPSAGDYFVGDTDTGEWLEYAIGVATADDYVVQFEVASATDAARISAAFTGATTGSVAIPNTGHLTNWTTVSAAVRLEAGAQIMRLGADAGGFSLRRVQIARAANVILVPSGGDLQAAIDAALPGDTILLEAGATYVGNFTLPVKAGDAYITIRSNAADAVLPGDDVRIGPADAPHLPKLRSPNTLPAIATAPSAHHYRLLFLELLANANGAGNIVALGDGGFAQDTLAAVPHHLIVDRVYIHGDVALGQKRGIALNSADTSIVNSYIAEIKAAGQDSQAIGGWNGPGPFLISNNYLEAAGENVMFGGADPAIPELVPSDITFTRNHLFKPLAWRGSVWTVKNLFELKSARRVLVDGNLMENNWLAAQAGYAVLLKSVNQDGTAPWSVVEDVVFTNNVVRNVSSALNVLGRDPRYPAIEANHIVIRNNLFAAVSAASYGGAGRFLQINGGTDIAIEHNTIISDGAVVVCADANPTYGFSFNDNILLHNLYGVKGSGTAVGNGTIATYFPGSQFFGSLFIGGNAYQYPSANFFPADPDAVGFVNYAGGDYRLSPLSPYLGSATDATNPGVAYEALASAFGAAR